MLILSRKLGERIRIGDSWVTLVDIDRNKVRLGITASKDVLVMREELLPAHEQFAQTHVVSDSNPN